MVECFSTKTLPSLLSTSCSSVIKIRRIDYFTKQLKKVTAMWVTL